MNAASIEIDGRRIGPEQPPYVVAEVSANHNGNLQRARDIIAMAHGCGADAIKLQTYTPDTMTIDCDRPEFQVTEGLWKGHNLYELYALAQTPFEWQQELFEHARDLGITVFSTPFDETAVDLLEELDCPAYKIASFEAVDLPLIARVARTGKPMIISTGMADEREIGEAIDCARDHGCRELAVLHCVSSYPAPTEQANLRTVADMARRFDVPAGLSDHTLGTATAVAGVALGACILEKHVTLGRDDGGPDAPFSLEPPELRRLVRDAHDAWRAIGTVRYGRSDAEEASVIFRRSIFVVHDIAEGECLTRENLRVIRPGHGLAPKHFNAVLGARAARSLRRGEPLTEEAVTPEWRDKRKAR